jgi:hypothetical protein
MGEKGNETQDGGGGGTQARLAPCRVCGEPRGDAAVCPQCGME